MKDNRSDVRARQNLRIVKLTRSDARRDSDHLLSFKNLVLSSEDMYPRIGEWLNHKVVPGIKASERVCYVGYQGGKAVVSAVVKRGESSKFCHLKIRQDLQNTNLGNAFFSLMALEVRLIAEEIHFTLPESLWEEKKQFFQSFGFAKAVKSKTQYRLFDKELRCSADFEEVWNAVLTKLPQLMKAFSFGGQSVESQLLMSIRPDYAEQIISGQKAVEIRKRFSEKWTGKKVTIYASQPASSLLGDATVKSVICGEPQAVWNEFQQYIACSRQQFNRYIGTTNKVYAVVLGDVRPFSEKIPISQLSHLLKQDLKPPQSYSSLQKDSAWLAAVSMATLLHGTLGKSTMVRI